MKIILISNDADVISSINEIDIIKDDQFILCNSKVDSCEIISEIISSNPSLIIFDDDYINTDTLRILKSVRTIDSKVAIILVSSELSIDFGRELSQLAIHYKALKPISINNLEQSIKSLKKIAAH